MMEICCFDLADLTNFPFDPQRSGQSKMNGLDTSNYFETVEIDILRRVAYGTMLLSDPGAIVTLGMWQKSWARWKPFEISFLPPLPC